MPLFNRRKRIATFKLLSPSSSRTKISGVDPSTHESNQPTKELKYSDDDKEISKSLSSLKRQNSGNHHNRSTSMFLTSIPRICC